MPISINGTGSITGLSAGGLPDASVVTADIADSAVTTAKLAQPMTLATAQASTSGTAIDFTGIPSWAKRVTVIADGVSTNGTSVVLIQLGSGSTTTSGYTNYYILVPNGIATQGQSGTAGFILGASGASALRDGHYVFTNISGNKWIASGMVSDASNTFVSIMAGKVSLSGTLDRVRITTVNGTDTFDAGSINIMYEG